MGQKTQEIELVTAATLDQIKMALQGAFKGAEFSPLRSTTGGLLDVGSPADIELLAQREGVGGAWAVQVYAWDRGADRTVSLVALGDGGFSRSMHGMRNTVSLSKSVKKAREAAELLRN